MENDRNKEERETNIADSETRQSLFSVSVVIVVIVACLVGLFGSFHYSNKATVEIQQESTTVAKHLDLKDEYQSSTVDDIQPAGHGQDSWYSAITQPSTEGTLSFEMKNSNKFEKKKTSSADVETKKRMDDTDQKEKENPKILPQTPSTGINTLTYQERETLKLTDKEISDPSDRKIDKGTYVSLGSNKKPDRMTAVKKKETKTEPEDENKESNSSLSLEENTRTDSISTAVEHNDKQVVQDDGKDKFKILPRRDGIKVGHVQNLELEPGKFYDVITRSLDPPIFEIPDFLAGHECQKLIDQATKLGLEKSHYQQPDISSEPTNQETFKGWDYDDDNVITPQEVVHTLQDTAYLFFTTADIEKMFVDLNIDQNGNGAMDLDEYLRVTNSGIVRYLQESSQTLPRTLHRNSKHTWLHYNDVEGLNQRVSALTKLPVEVVERSEKLQVVNYGPEGHYYCHIDSQDIEDGVPCCLANDRRTCRLCRYITVLYYLNNVEEGGETAFPVADNATFSHEEWAINLKHHCDFSTHCHQANVYIKPRKGTAIMWYNHLRDEKTGWLGRIDPRSFHGGCDVIKGRKWIANSWINIVGESRDTLVTYHPTSDPIP